MFFLSLHLLCMTAFCLKPVSAVCQWFCPQPLPQGVSHKKRGDSFTKKYIKLAGNLEGEGCCKYVKYLSFEKKMKICYKFHYVLQSSYTQEYPEEAKSRRQILCFNHPVNIKKQKQTKNPTPTQNHSVLHLNSFYVLRAGSSKTSHGSNMCQLT